MNRQALQEMLIRHEGLRLKPYTDTVGKVTIGVGRNLTDNGITKEEAVEMLRHDMDAAIAEAVKNFPWFLDLTEERQRVVVSMLFNMGLPKLKGFKNFLAAVEAQDYETASKEMKNSQWAKQVGMRAVELSILMFLPSKLS